MVSVLLLTTEEILQRNTFWYCLDTIWISEDLEPFEEVKYEHQFVKPLSRDFYYAKYPEIPRSESDEENSLSLKGFKSKHCEWKSKIRVRRYDAQRRNSSQSYLSCSGVKSNKSESLNNETKRITSLGENRSKNVLNYAKNDKILNQNNDKKVLDFLKRLQENIPPPPIENMQHSRDISSGSIEPLRQSLDFNDVELLDYEDFENNIIHQTKKEDELPTTSTLKKSNKKVNFKLYESKTEFESHESWYDSIYGISDFISSTADNIVQSADSRDVYNDNNMDYDSDRVVESLSWTEISINESIISTEEIISQSHANQRLDDLEIGKDDDEETYYARFAIYKILHTLKIKAGYMLDSSSMKDLSKIDDNLISNTRKETAFSRTIYSLAPNAIDDVF